MKRYDKIFQRSTIALLAIVFSIAQTRRYCQISEEAQPRNSLAPRTQGALALGPSGNVQGGHKFYTLNTGMVVVQQDWKVLPMPPSVIDRIHSKVQGQPAQSIFAD